MAELRNIVKKKYSSGRGGSRSELRQSLAPKKQFGEQNNANVYILYIRISELALFSQMVRVWDKEVGTRLAAGVSTFPILQYSYSMPLTVSTNAVSCLVVRDHRKS